MLVNRIDDYSSTSSTLLGQKNVLNVTRAGVNAKEKPDSSGLFILLPIPIFLLPACLPHKWNYRN